MFNKGLLDKDDEKKKICKVASNERRRHGLTRHAKRSVVVGGIVVVIIAVNCNSICGSNLQLAVGIALLGCILHDYCTLTT